MIQENIFMDNSILFSQYKVNSLGYKMLKKDIQLAQCHMDLLLGDRPGSFLFSELIDNYGL